nr:uncharacterized protein LOC101787837 isoform X1 [Cavia porcellus]XP_013013930.1 uncharacterized protein LOC101787837 isoform X1 [Cavia porcellus]XP_023423108.1 uncharacterized protein LOC101787837 isoform X1 [Cavia porcellus]
MNACPGPHSGRDSPVPGREQSCPEGKQASSVLFHVNSQECDPQRLEIGSTRRGTAELQETHKLKIRGHSRGSQGQIGKEAAALGRELERLEGQTALADEGARAGQSKDARAVAAHPPAQLSRQRTEHRGDSFVAQPGSREEVWVEGEERTRAEHGCVNECCVSACVCKCVGVCLSQIVRPRVRIYGCTRPGFHRILHNLKNTEDQYGGAQL